MDAPKPFGRTGLRKSSVGTLACQWGLGLETCSHVSFGIMLTFCILKNVQLFLVLSEEKYQNILAFHLLSGKRTFVCRLCSHEGNVFCDWLRWPYLLLVAGGHLGMPPPLNTWSVKNCLCSPSVAPSMNHLGGGSYYLADQVFLFVISFFQQASFCILREQKWERLRTLRFRTPLVHSMAIFLSQSCFMGIDSKSLIYDFQVYSG